MFYHFRPYAVLFVLAGILFSVHSVPVYAHATIDMQNSTTSANRVSAPENLIVPDLMTNIHKSSMVTTNTAAVTPQMTSVSSAKPTIKFVSVPAYGSFDNLSGQVKHASPSQYRVVVYIYVRNGWWVKPYYNQSQTIITPDGHWTCDITTGGIDQLATKIVAYLIPANYTPPSLLGAAKLPAELGRYAVAKVKTTRRP